MIDVVEFCKAYDSTVAVSGLSFRVASGQILGLVGPNGAGKTTTLRSMTGIIPSSGGKIRIAGFDLDRNPLEVKQRTGYVPDDPQLFNDLTVEQHLAFTASIYGVDEATSIPRCRTPGRPRSHPLPSPALSPTRGTTFFEPRKDSRAQ